MSMFSRAPIIRRAIGQISEVGYVGLLDPEFHEAADLVCAGTSAVDSSSIYQASVDPDTGLWGSFGSAITTGQSPLAQTQNYQEYLIWNGGYAIVYCKNATPPYDLWWAYPDGFGGWTVEEFFANGASCYNVICTKDPTSDTSHAAVVFSNNGVIKYVTIANRTPVNIVQLDVDNAEWRTCDTTTGNPLIACTQRLGVYTNTGDIYIKPVVGTAYWLTNENDINVNKYGPYPWMSIEGGGVIRCLAHIGPALDALLLNIYRYAGTSVSTADVSIAIPAAAAARGMKYFYGFEPFIFDGNEYVVGNLKDGEGGILIGNTTKTEMWVFNAHTGAGMRIDPGDGELWNEPEFYGGGGRCRIYFTHSNAAHTVITNYMIDITDMLALIS